MRIDVHWIIDGVMAVEADNPSEAEKKVSELLAAFIQSQPELTSHFGAKAIQGQALSPDAGEDNTPPRLDS